jgi:hypothetical protein
MAHEKDAAAGSMKLCGGLVLGPAIISPPIPALRPPASRSFRPSARPSRFGSSYRNLRGAFRKTRMDMKKVKRNLERKGEGEFDLVTVVVKNDVGRYAEKAGLYVLTQTDEGGAALLNREGFEPRTFEWENGDVYAFMRFWLIFLHFSLACGPGGHL